MKFTTTLPRLGTVEVHAYPHPSEGNGRDEPCVRGYAEVYAYQGGEGVELSEEETEELCRQAMEE